MSTNIKPENRRLLEAVEYIDEGMILDALSVLRLPKEEYAEPVRTWKTPFKYWKQFAALAACLILLSTASPLAGYISQVISNFRAGAGSTSETTNGMYDEYILTEEDLAELNEAEFIESVVKDPNYAGKDEAFFDDLREQLKDNKFIKFALSVEHAMERSTDPGDNFYFGKYGDCIVVARNIGAQTGCSPALQRKYILGEYIFSYKQSIMQVCYNSEFYDIKKAYEMGLITDSDVKIMYELYCEYYVDGGSNKTSN